MKKILVLLVALCVFTTMVIFSQSQYVKFNIINNSQQINSNNIYLYFVANNTLWFIDKNTGVATQQAQPKEVFLRTLSELKKIGGAIKLDATSSITSARIYLSTSPTAVTASSGLIVPTTNAPFYYDFVEFTLTPGVLNIDLTQVDQFGFPLTLQVTPNDPNSPLGAGIVPGLGRQKLISKFQAMTTGKLSPFADCVFSASNGIYRLLNPKNVISNQLNATLLYCTIATSGTSGNWLATLTITGPGSSAPTNGGLQVGMNVSGPFIPAGATIINLPSFPTGNSIVLTSTQPTNPFSPSTTPAALYFYKAPTTKLSTYFDTAIVNFFKYCKANPGYPQVEQNSNGTNVIYKGNVVQIQTLDINGTTSTYTVLQFTGNGETYNLYFPFFTTNSPAGTLTPFNTPVPPPPSWWSPGKGMMCYEPPSAMVFGCDGVFADNALQTSTSNSTILGAIENVIVSALVRGHATAWHYRTGTINPPPPPFHTAKVTLSTDSTTNLTNQMYMYSFQIASTPMTPITPFTPGSPLTSFNVSSPQKILPTQPDLLSFAQFYPSNGTWSAFSQFFHQQTVTIGGVAYGFPYDDQGGFSSDLSSTFSATNPASVTITIGPWN